MPAFIRTPQDEARWEKAKQAANKTRSESDGNKYWGLVNHIYHQMSKAELPKTGAEAAIQRVNLIRNLVKTNPELFLLNQGLLDKVVDVLIKARGDDEEEEDQGYDLQDYSSDEGLNNEDLEGMSVIDDPYQDEDDEAGKWLREQEMSEAVPKTPETEKEDEEATPEISEKLKSRSSYSDWKPHGNYTPEQKAQIEEHVKNGYSEREAERLADAHKGPKTFQEALSHTVRPSQPSSKMLDEMKELAGHWLDRADRHAKINANPEKNPQKFASGKMLQAHEENTKDYNKAYNEFLNSDELKNMKGLERHKAVQAFKQNWKQQNPEYEQNLLSGVGEAQKHYGEASQARAQSLDEAMRHIITGGQQEGAMSTQEAAQHVGGTKGDEGYSSTIIKDPSASFAQQNPQLIEKLRAKLQPEQFDRFNRVRSARAAQGVEKPKTVIRRPGGSSGQGAV